MTEKDEETLAGLFVACWKDDVLKARFINEPRTVLAECGMTIPEELTIKVVENEDQIVHLTLPLPPDDHENLTIEELSSAAGGVSGNMFNPDIL